MRFAGNSHPEWGYLAPAPSFLRTARTVIVATAIGATAGAAVVLSLVDRPAADANQSSVSVAARTLARPGAEAVPAAVNNAATGKGVAVPSAAVFAPAQPAQAQPVQAQPAQNAAPAQKLAGSQDRAKEVRKDGAVTSSESGAAPSAQPPAAIAALAEAPAAQDPLDASPTQTQAAAEASPTADPAPAQKKSAKKHRAAPRYASRGDQPNGATNNGSARPMLLQRLFNYGGDTRYGGYYRFSDSW